MENINNEEVTEKKLSSDKLSVPMAIIVAGLLIGGAILLKGSSPTQPLPTTDNKNTETTLAPVTTKDRTMGDTNAKVTLVMYEDFQCPFCGAISGLQTDSEAISYLKNGDPKWTPFMPEILTNYVNTGKVLFVYRDFAFLGDESTKASEAARCAEDQNKFWEYHDYLYAHQKGENQGNFSNANLKMFAKTLGLDQSSFDKCLDSDQYAQAIADSNKEGANAGISSTPKGFILLNGKVVSTIDGAEPYYMVKEKIDQALK
jgi:protein-disulfide isomerase